MRDGSGDPQVLVYLHQPCCLWVISTLVGDVLDACLGKELLKLMSVLSIKWRPIITPNNLGKTAS